MAEPAPAPQPPIFNLQAYSPAEIKEAVEKVGVKKANLPLLASFMLAIVAGGGSASVPSTTRSLPAIRRSASPRPASSAGLFSLSDWRSSWSAAPSSLRATI